MTGKSATRTRMEGFEGATAYAIADAMGFTPDKVDWVPNAVFEQAFAPGPKPFDFHMAQISIRPKRALAVDFSDPYFDCQPGGPGAPSNAIDRCGADDQRPQGLQAGRGGQHDELRSDRHGHPADGRAGRLSRQHGRTYGTEERPGRRHRRRPERPRSTCATPARRPDPEGKVVGQFSTDLQADHVGAVLQKDSPLTPCVNQALAADQGQTARSRRSTTSGSTPARRSRSSSSHVALSAHERGRANDPAGAAGQPLARGCSAGSGPAELSSPR